MGECRGRVVSERRFYSGVERIPSSGGFTRLRLNIDSVSTRPKALVVKCNLDLKGDIFIFVKVKIVRFGVLRCR